jgi:hypothetical protein
MILCLFNDTWSHGFDRLRAEEEGNGAQFMGEASKIEGIKLSRIIDWDDKHRNTARTSL